MKKNKVEIPVRFNLREAEGKDYLTWPCPYCTENLGVVWELDHELTDENAVHEFEWEVSKHIAQHQV